MDPRKDPTRRCLKVEAWPEADRRAWATALEPGDVLDPGGIASNWKPLTRYTVEKSYGRWLTWLAHHRLLEAGMAPEQRASKENISRYIHDLQAVNAPFTVLSRVRNLYNALRSMAPAEDWQWLLQVVCRQRRRVVSVRNKRTMMIPSDELFDFGLALMDEADGPTGGTPLQRAKTFQDGLMIALLSARPIRRRNFASVELGRHLVRRGTDYWLQFDGAETKTGVPIEAPLPAVLAPYLERYLTEHRPALCGRRYRGNWISAEPAEAGTALWVSSWSTAMSEGTIYGRIVNLTKAKFGHALSPHLFRDCAATSIAIADPEHVRITTSILGHASLATSERHYNQAQSLEATQRHQDHIVELRRRRRDDVE